MRLVPLFFFFYIHSKEADAADSPYNNGCIHGVAVQLVAWLIVYMGELVYTLLTENYEDLISRPRMTWFEVWVVEFFSGDRRKRITASGTKTKQTLTPPRIVIHGLYRSFRRSEKPTRLSQCPRAIGSTRSRSRAGCRTTVSRLYKVRSTL
jgi:hypothetical protein